ncbi:MAG: Rsd/AlgQ family anti-sigma factor [Oceanospirillaceae bacterium]|jgi:regulator of sigma D|uniref:Rsd/AlgQ family anti-sigma factor n=1 Tax=Marinobacterium litorale TaxID=404770 RepID=UPI000404E1D5|nr:Rsd/AlgQ family anti-sigma factor [Marinobacterium litorale]MBS99210.1 Rsd/AlgQ family anti-sigma factor [Oceanospirillaceae bacterium]
MLEKCRNAQERWGGVSDIIDQWLEQRQRLISTLFSLSDCQIGEELNTQLTLFCDLMMDYVSSGHFEVYEQLLREGSDYADGSVEQVQDIFPKIQPTTDSALDFNDQYGTFDAPTLREIRDFTEDLSRLGETLEDRFELEDQLIEVLHTAHNPAIAASGA